MNKKRIFSGIQPSGNLHLGNYLGAIKNWVKLQDEYDSIFCVVDLHAITVPQDPERLRRQTLDVAKVYLASGIDPEKCSLFIQSHISEHAELAWMLNTIAKMQDLLKMSQFVDKAMKGFDGRRGVLKKKIEGQIINREVLFEEETEQYLIYKTGVGLFDYPVLMAADILLYDTELVPVGKDQVQHIELTRTLANRFNKKFGDTFVIPKPYTTEVGQNIMGLDDPTKKMSKSAASEYNYIALTDDKETVKRKIKKAVTDSGSEIIYSNDKPALKNLINIYSLLSDIPAKEIEKRYKGKGYADFKTDLADIVVSFIRPFQEKLKEYDDEKVLEILRAGAEKVRPLAKKKLDEVKKRIGFII
ncbi:MAG: tryptophan--tRNA ligase [Candidatus Moranbacteria bacterium RIFOXYA12_FULL_44_15]|nr:MAG: tryptophan--tRNA ligase [Candidatus Moranbacteria bacterium RIFOXYA12_FULL_44_15]OGI34512.1 MAG: tryptophan--tRNA ligase [Candidatus Moranbacteria bacterium RIFOXYA2_FULL_43_15]